MGVEPPFFLGLMPLIVNEAGRSVYKSLVFHLRLYLILIHTVQNSSTNMMKLLVCSLTLTALVVGYPAPGHYLIETEDEPLLDDDFKLPGDARDDSAKTRDDSGEWWRK